MFCKNCGTAIDDNAQACPTCGTQMNAEQAAPVVEPAPAPVVEPAPAPAPTPVYVAPTPIYVTEPQQPRIPEQYEPMGAWAFFWLRILYMIPIVGFIFLIVFSFNDSNLSRRNFTRSYWCGLLVIAVIALIFGVISALIFGSVRSSFYY